MNRKLRKMNYARWCQVVYSCTLSCNDFRMFARWHH